MDVQFVSAFVVLCIAGIINAGFLIWKHRQKKPLVCPMNHDCRVVTESTWSHVLFIRNEVLGFLFYAILFAGMLLAVLFPGSAPALVFLIVVTTGFGLLFSIFLVLLQIVVIQDYCFYCILSTIITLFAFLTGVMLLAG